MIKGMLGVVHKAWFGVLVLFDIAMMSTFLFLPIVAYIQQWDGSHSDGIFLMAFMWGCLAFLLLGIGLRCLWGKYAIG